MYNNPENINPSEISKKISDLGFGPNRIIRFKLLCNYSTDIISKEEWIERYCVK